MSQYTSVCMAVNVSVCVCVLECVRVLWMAACWQMSVRVSECVCLCVSYSIARVIVFVVET